MLKAVVLPGAVRADEALQVTAADLEIEAVQRPQATELDARLHRLEQHLAAHVSPFRAPATSEGRTSQISRVPNRPWGRTSIRMTRRIP